MFISVKNLTALMDMRIKYVEEARENNLGDDDYFAEMERLLNANLKKLEYISSNKKLINKYTTLVNNLF